MLIYLNLSESRTLFIFEEVLFFHLCFLQMPFAFYRLKSKGLFKMYLNIFSCFAGSVGNYLLVVVFGLFWFFFAKSPL